MAKDDIDFGSRARPVEGQVIPAVYLFQPAYYVVVENEELDQWQQMLEEKVGLSPDDVAEMTRQGVRAQGTYCLCGSTAFSEACDCDQMQQ